MNRMNLSTSGRFARCRRTGTTSWANRGGHICLARSPLPNIPGQEKGGGGTGQTGEPAAAEAQHPGRELRRPAELIERDAEQKRTQESRAKADARIDPDRCPSETWGGNREHARSEVRKVALHDEAGNHGKA